MNTERGSQNQNNADWHPNLLVADRIAESDQVLTDRLKTLSMRTNQLLHKVGVFYVQNPRTAMILASLAIAGIITLTNTHDSLAFNNLIQDPGNSCIGHELGAHPDGGYCSLLCSPDGINPVRVIEGSCTPYLSTPFSEPASIPAPTVIPTETPTVIPGIGVPSEVFPVPTETVIFTAPPSQPNSDAGLLLCGSGTLLGALLVADRIRSKLRKSIGTHETRDDAYKQGLRDGINHGGQIEKIKKTDPKVLERQRKEEEKYRRKHEID